MVIYIFLVKQTPCLLVMGAYYQLGQIWLCCGNKPPKNLVYIKDTFLVFTPCWSQVDQAIYCRSFSLWNPGWWNSLYMITVAEVTGNTADQVLTSFKRHVSLLLVLIGQIKSQNQAQHQWGQKYNAPLQRRVSSYEQLHDLPQRALRKILIEACTSW